MRVWLDALTPKQFLFANELKPRLEERGHEPLITVRYHPELEKLVDKLSLPVRRIGGYSEAYREGKLLASTERLLELSRLIPSLGADVLLHFASPEASRVAFGLGIRSICVCDSPHAKHACYLSIPLSDRLLTPWVIPYSAWRPYCKAMDKISRYRALDPAAWIHDLQEGEGGKVLVRMVESRASYLMGLDPSWGIEFVLRLVKALEGEPITILARYRDEASRLRSSLKGCAEVIDGGFIGQELLRECRLFIGMGGTMTTEAALMGIPSISAYPAEATYIERFLLRKGLLVRCSKPEEIGSLAKTLMKPRARSSWRARAKRLLEWMEDPLDAVIREIEVRS